MRISDWSSDVCSSDLALATGGSLLRRRLAEQNLDLRALAQVFIDGRGRLLLQLAAQVLLHLLLGRRLGHRAALDLDDVVAELRLHRHLDRKSTRLNYSH